jgi:hypothetical protein
VNAAQKQGLEKSFDFERNRDNCASRHAFARGSPACHRRINSVINWLVALSLTFQWLASTVCAPAMRKARRKDITPSPIFTSPAPLSQALRMTNSVPCKFSSPASSRRGLARLLFSAFHFKRATNPACSKCLSPVSASRMFSSSMTTKEIQSVSGQSLSRR